MQRLCGASTDFSQGRFICEKISQIRKACGNVKFTCYMENVNFTLTHYMRDHIGVVSIISRREQLSEDREIPNKPNGNVQ